MYALARPFLAALMVAHLVVAQLGMEVLYCGPDGKIVELKPEDSFIEIPATGHVSYTTHSGSQGGGMDPREESVLYDQSWCGAQGSSNVTGVQEVHATFDVPSLTRRDQPGVQNMSAWVGLDGYTCSTLVKAGIKASINEQGKQSSQLFVEWWPEGAYALTNLTVNTGDCIAVAILPKYMIHIQINITNLSTGEANIAHIDAHTPICIRDFEWMVEDATIGSDKDDFAKFSNFSFKNAAAITSDTINILDQSMLYNLKDDEGNVVCTVQPGKDYATLDVESH